MMTVAFTVGAVVSGTMIWQVWRFRESNPKAKPTPYEENRRLVEMGGHSNWPEWIYIGIVIALMTWVGAEAWEAERLVEHVPEDAESYQSNRSAMVLDF